MFTKNQLGLVLLLSAGIIGKFYTINADDTDELIHCKGEEMVVGHVIGEYQKNCSIELHSTPENTSCIGICVLQHLEGVDEKGMPSKEKFDKIVDEKVTADLRDKIKKTDCFDHAPKIEKGADLCNTLKDFESCFDKLLIEICKTPKS